MKYIKILFLVCFFFFWLFALTFIVPQTSFSVLTSYEATESISTDLPQKMLKGQKIKGEIMGDENNMGIVYLRFQSPNAVSFEEQDTLVFRLKEKGENDWRVINEYKSGLIEGLQLFPFGFSAIKDSKNKEYVFELESLSGDNINAVTVSSEFPNVITQYQFETSEIVSNPFTLVSFLSKKVWYSIINPEYVLSSLSYFLPFLLFGFWLLFSKKIKSIAIGYKKNINLDSFLFLHLIFISMISTVFADFSYIHSVIYLLFSVFWISAIIYYKLDFSVTIVYSFVFFFVSLIMIVFHNKELIERGSTWSYLLLLIGVAQLLLDRLRNEKRVGFKDFVNKTISSKK